MNANVKPANASNLSVSRSLVIVGMPGAGKSSVGRKLAVHFGIPFIDSDNEVEAAARMTIEQIFDQLGESAFRDGEQRVIARLLDGQPCVLATGGGAFMNEATRTLIKQKAFSIWLRADLGILLERTARRDDRPLLKHGNPAQILQELLIKREPFYSMADVIVTSDKRSLRNMTERVVEALQAFMNEESSTGAHNMAPVF